MKNTRVYHLDFARDIETVVWEYSNLPETDRTNLSSIQFEMTFDYTDQNKNYNFVIITDTAQMSKYVKILQDNMILHFIRDISKLLLKDNVSFDKIERVLDKTTTSLFKKFKTKMNEWILRNQDLDNVLDMINEKGINKIREIDKKFLEEYGKEK